MRGDRGRPLDAAGVLGFDAASGDFRSGRGEKVFGVC